VIVAIEAASVDLSIALAEPDGRLIGRSAWRSAQRQSAELLPRLLALLDEHGRRLESTQLAAVGIGPGSFTGLRVAMSLAKGLAMALSIPIVGIPSLEAWLDAEPQAKAALSRAGAREAYLHERGTGEMTMVDRDALPATLRAAKVVAPHDLVDAFGIVDAVSPRRATDAIALRAAERAASGATDDLRTLEPLYLRAPRGVSDAQGATVRWL
jgi:tRNA threonylcarbamoyl adenosine modification protein YeaZ